MSQLQNTGKDILDFVNEAAFRSGVMPRAQLSKLACEIALKRSTNKDVLQFAEWELMEAATVIDVLQDLDTKQVSLSEEAAAFITQLENLSGIHFDNA